MFEPGGGQRWCLSRAAAVGLFCAVALLGCRRQTIWAGAEFSRANGGQLRLAAQQPLCGCMTLVNQSPRDLLLRSTLHGSAIGGATIKAGDRLRFRFDWAGPANDDYYLLEGTENGEPVDLSTVVRLAETSRWQPCSTIDCAYGTLHLDIAESAH